MIMFLSKPNLHSWAVSLSADSVDDSQAHTPIMAFCNNR